jgi:phage shock protein PspC (stress-responsive transcriptional regulator)
MNKTIIININGFVFHIEEDAYEILKNYMTDVKRHFLNSADSLEITTDIENRIAEMFNEILAADNKQVIVEQDVTSVIEQMGRVEDFDYPEDGNEPASGSAYSYPGARTLFRDGEDHILGGVCAGLANYFNTEPVWIRLAFAIAFFFAGTGLILYIILWIVIPKAATRADRMAMKGQRLDLQGFKKNFEDEMQAVRGRLTEFGQEARPMVYRARDFFGEFGQHLGAFFSGAGKFFVKFFCGIILLFGFGMLIALLITIIGFWAFGKGDLYHIFPFNIMEHQLNYTIVTAAFMLLAIPLIVIIMAAVNGLTSRRSLNRGVGSTLLAVWIVVLIVVIYYAAQISANFRHSASFSKNVAINTTAGGVYYLKLNDAKYMTAEDSARLRIKEQFGHNVTINDNDDDDDMQSPNNVTISIEKSDVAKPILVETYSARGYDYSDALRNAQSTSYQFLQQDSVLKFNRRLEKPYNRLWRSQEVHLTLKIPVNARLVIDKSLHNWLWDINVYQCAQDNGMEKSPSAPFIMTADGLQCNVDSVAAKKRAATMKNDE